MQDRSWLEKMADTLSEWGAMMLTREFWGIIAVGVTVVGFLVAAGIMLIDFDGMRMRNCFNASNMSAYLMFNVLMFFALGGVMALGEVFNYFDCKKQGVEHKVGPLFWLVIITTALGSIGLVMLKVSC